MNSFTRRDALKSLGISALGLSFARLGVAHAEEVLPAGDLAGWMRSLSKNEADLARQRISPLQWQEMMDQIYRSTPLAQLKRHLDFQKLSKAILEKMPADRHELFHTIELGAPSPESPAAKAEPHGDLIVKVAHIRKGHAVPPHGHSNMVSAFLCLSGEFDVRLYDRLDNREQALVVRDTLHQANAGPGTWSSVSDYRDNVHWLTAKTDDCFLFTVKMLSVEEGLPLNGRINIDVRRAKQLGGNTLLAPKITSNEARELY